ncbi:MAG: protein-disulfide reductase DsbD family protein [Oceanococcaceae bacterium]
MLAAPLAMAAAPQSVAEQPHVRAELLADVQALRAGQSFRASVRLEPEAGWHTYWINPGDSGLATRLEWNLPAGLEAGPLQWPFPERESLGPLTNYGYAHAHDLISRIQTAQRPGSAVLPLRVQAEWLVCKEICIPGSAVLGLDIPYAEQSIDSIHKASLDASQSRVPQREDWPARFAIEDKALRLHLPEEAVQGAKQVELFPLTPEILANADIPQLRRAEGGLWMQQALSEYFAGPPQSLEMVAVLDGQRAIQFSASPGPLPALPDPLPQSRAGAASAWLPALGLALLGGLLLNLMPCVFPVLSIKALALARDAGADGQQRRAHALLYTGGVLTGFVGLAAVLLALRGAGAAVGWGFQLQSPWLVGSLAYLMLALGLALHGYWQFGTRLMGLGQGLVDGGGAKGAYFTGLLACVVATPCTAPFMGAAMGYALTQPALLALSVFAALGLGMALPFLLLGWVPALASWLPRPGAWMERCTPPPSGCCGSWGGRAGWMPWPWYCSGRCL